MCVWECSPIMSGAAYSFIEPTDWGMNELNDKRDGNIVIVSIAAMNR